MQPLALGFVVLTMLAHVGCDSIFRFSPTRLDAAATADSVASDGFPAEDASAVEDSLADSSADIVMADLPDGATPQPIEQTFCCSDTIDTGFGATASFTTKSTDSLLVVAVGILSDVVVPDAQLGATVHCSSCPGQLPLTLAVTSTETSRYHAQLWYLVNPPVGTFDVEAKTSHPTTFVALITTVWVGVDAENPFHGNGPDNTVSQPGGSVELQLDNCPVGAMAVDAAMGYGQIDPQEPTVSSQPTSWHRDYSTFWLGTSYRAAVPPLTTMAWSSSARDISAVADCLRATR